MSKNRKIFGTNRQGRFANRQGDLWLFANRQASRFASKILPIFGILTCLGRINANTGGGSTLPVTIPSYYGHPNENVNAWFVSLETIFATRTIEEVATRIQYAATGMKNATGAWWMTKITTNPDVG